MNFLNKILNLSELASWRQAQRAAGKRVVATNGIFDILHVGHLRYLAQARALGDLLLIGLNSDSSTRQLKGPTRPLNLEEERAEILAGLCIVDGVVIFHEMRATNFLTIAQPDIYVKGGDYTIDKLDQNEVSAVRSHGGDIRILPLVPGRSTSELVKRIQAL